jgi:hypothetical protein
VVLQDDPAPGRWYCVEYSNSHTVARDFFVDTVRHSPFGNRHHPFMRSPALFIYRNPLDIVASEASYYHQDGKSAFAGYLSHLSTDQRLLRLIEDPWLLGTIRDRIGGFLPWLELPNVIPVSFEELVGPGGGGSDELQRGAVWSIQLKLQVPGRPDQLAGALFNRDSPTFDAARIGRYRETFNDEAYARFFALPQDFMTVAGYEGAGRDGTVLVPQRAHEFRTRPIRFSHAEDDSPITVQTSYLGFNIVRFRNQYFAVRQSESNIDLRRADLDALQAAGDLAAMPSADGARRAAEYLAIRDVVEALPARVTLLKEDCNGFEILKYGGQFYALARWLEPLDLTRADIPTLLSTGDLLVARSQQAIERVAHAVPPAIDPGVPVLWREGWRGFNIVRYARRFYAVAQRVGPFDLATADISALVASGNLLIGESESAIEALVEASVAVLAADHD